jgi:hypothetical protein
MKGCVNKKDIKKKQKHGRPSHEHKSNSRGGLAHDK